MKDYILAKLNDLKTKSGKSYEAVHDALGYAASTVHRWHKGESDPDLDQLTNLVEFYGGDMAHLFEVVGRQEIAASQGNGYQGVATMSEAYEARLRAKDEQIAMLTQQYEQQLAQQREDHQRSIDYLKQESDWMRKIIENLTARGQ